MVQVDMDRGCGTPSGDNFVYVKRNGEYYFFGGYYDSQLPNILFVLKTRYGYNNIKITKKKMLCVGNKPIANKESTTSAIKRVTEYEKNLNRRIFG